MTTISSSGLGGSQPFARVQNVIQRDAAAGSISSTDETALVSALSDISAQLAPATGATGATPSSSIGTATAPASMRDQVNLAIDNEVSSGKLTGAQGTELKAAFQQAHAHMHGAHGHHGGGGMLAAATDDQSATATSTGSLTGTVETAATNAISALESFLTQFKAAVSSTGTYGAGGSSNTASSSLLINSIG